MATILVAYVSMSGNTEEIGDLIAEGIRRTDATVEQIHIEEEELSADALIKYDGILLGSYTWGHGDLPYEMEPFYDDMVELDLSKTRFGVFGSCDSAYEIYGGAVDLLHEKFLKCGSTPLLTPLKIELAPMGEDMELCKAYGERFATRLLASVVK
ncbi:flavodoxin [Litoribacterium kuwaitense]|uniref:flavodoxin n=1 Tax=Litoribacterium kuwaitense TaxID=1398745 RepID=UPI001FEB05DF|nr:flavodoxin [Litoribacterium kuwaitense]